MRIGRDLTGQPKRRLQQAVGLGQPIGQTHPVGLGTLVEAAGQTHLSGPAEADALGQ